MNLLSVVILEYSSSQTIYIFKNTTTNFHRIWVSEEQRQYGSKTGVCVELKGLWTVTLYKML